VAFVLGKKFLDTENIRKFELIPGCALVIVIPWHDGKPLTILNTHAPNSPEERGRTFGESELMTQNFHSQTMCWQTGTLLKIRWTEVLELQRQFLKASKDLKICYSYMMDGRQRSQTHEITLVSNTEQIG
jgi:hypothetical protein